MALGLGSSLIRGGASLLTYVKDNLKLYLDFKSSRSDTLAFPSEGSTSFDGNDYIQLSAPFSHTNHSISVWANHSGINEVIFSAQDDSSDGIRLFIDDGNRLQYKVNGSNALVTSASYPNQWVHYVCTYDGSTMRVYANGVEVKTNSLSGVTVDTTTNARIGATSFENGGYFEGKLANVGLWSRVLSPEEVQSVMNKSYSQLGSVEKTSLVSWWALDSQSDNKVLPHDGEILGSELIADGDFALTGTQGSATTGTYWFTNTHMTIANGKAHFADTGGGALDLEGDSPFASTGLYKFQFEVSNTVSGSAKLRFKEGSNTIITESYNNGTHQLYFQITSTGGNFQIDPRSSGGVEHDLSNLSLKKVTTNVGIVTGATTTTSVYGGNAPILPRAIDIAESQAEQIGDGSAYFNGGTATDKIVVPYNASFAGGTNALTVACWVKNDSTITNWGGFVDLHYDYNFRLGRHSTDNFVVWKIDNETNGSELTGGVFKDENWHHVVGTVNGANMYIYLNGVRVATKTNNLAKVGGGSNQASIDLFIGRNNNWTSEAFGGNIAGVGIWQGALSQSQVQSLMESTSYAKIPASVKSTTSTLITSGDWTLSGSWVYDSSIGHYTNTYVNGTDTPVGNILASPTTTQGNLYKLSYTVVSATGSPTLKFPNNMLGLSSSNIPYTVGKTNVHYGVDGGSNESIGIRSSTGVGTIVLKDVKFEEVTNDLVAYYPLDANSSRGNGTDDVTTGEVLGNELADTTTYTGSSANAETYIRTSAVPTTGGLYKLTFDVDSYTSGSFYFTTNTGSNPRVEPSVYNAINTSIGSAVGSKTYYLKINAGGGFKFKASNLAYSGNVSNISLKEITSNTGVLY